MTDGTQKHVLLLGQETQELFETFTDTGTDYKTAMDKLDVPTSTLRYFGSGKKNSKKIRQ